MPIDFYGAAGLIGGGVGDLDAIDGADLADKDGALVVKLGVAYRYHLDADSGAGENSPLVIAPDANPGDKRWLLCNPSPLASDWNCGAEVAILIDSIRAHSVDGLALYDKDGKGIFVEDGGQVGVGIDIPTAGFHLVTPGATAMKVASSSGSYMRILVDATVAGMDAEVAFAVQGSTKWSVGVDGTDSSFNIHNTFGAFDGTSQFQIMLNDEFRFNPGAVSGETPAYKFYGFRAGDAKRTLSIGVGVDAINQVTFSGLATYNFTGALDVTGNIAAGGSVEATGEVSGSHCSSADGWTGSWVNNEAETVTVQDGVITDVS